MRSTLLASLSALLLVLPAVADAAESLATWTLHPADGKGASVAGSSATLTGDKWASLRAPKAFADVHLAATVTIAEPAKSTRFFGQGWSAWPDATFSDGGFDAGLLLRAGTNSGYRVQLSHRYQVVALVKWPEGGYVRVVPCAVKLNHPHKLWVSAQGSFISVNLDGEEKIGWDDVFLPLETGAAGIAVHDGAKATFRDVLVEQAPSVTRSPSGPHTPNFSVRPFLGGRLFVFDRDEPVLQLHYEKDPSVFAKLRPGYKPQLTWDSHWDLANQGAFKDADSKWTAPVTSGGGKSVKATWSARSVKDRFTTQSTLTVGYDAKRGTYTYDIESALEVLPGEPFHFRYGFDFEHHTPLDPFRWQYLLAKRAGGAGSYHRPVYPIDPGPQNDLETAGGARVWFGRHLEQLHVAPAVEYDISSATSSGRKLNTAVCAAFYDTGVSFAPETAKPGTRLEVKYRYTGVPAAEAKSLFDQSKIYDSPTLDPQHHYVFADEWPKLTFSQHVPMSETWIYGRTPFMTAHNTRPTYELVKNCGAGSGFALKLGSASFGKANLPKAAPLARGRYAVTALVKADNVHGPGGRIELTATQAKTNKKLAEARHYVGSGSFDWRQQGFAFEVPEDAGALELAFGNAGSGDFLVTEVEFRKLADGEALPAGLLAKANDTPAPIPAAPPGAIADYRMLEGKGLVVLNHATGSLGHLDLANLDFVTDAGRSALRFADNPTGRKAFRQDSGLNRYYLSHPGYAGKDTLPIALTGHHGGGASIPGLTLAAWVKPAPAMGSSHHGGRGDVIGYGARRFILGLHGQTAPYQLAARINVNDSIVSTAKLDAEKWQHVAMTAEPKDGQWLVRLYLDGQPVGEGQTKKFPADSPIVPSLILGAEIFYFHDAYYRGLIGRTLVLHRVANASEITELAKGK